MTSTIRIVALLMFLFQTPATKGSIGGLVFTAGTKLPVPIPNARLELQGGSGNPLVVRTDGSGRFAFSNLDPGRYRLTAAHDGYVQQEYGQRNPNAPGAMITLIPGQQIKDVAFQLTPTGTIAGWVRDQDSEPLANAVVYASRLSYGPNGERTMSRQYATHSNDRGEYRLFYMTPGEYFVSATYAPNPPGPVFSPPNVNVAPERPGYVPVYFPGSTDPSDATPIKVEPAKEAGGIGIAMRRLPTSFVRGLTLNSATGKPTAAVVILAPVMTGGMPMQYQAQATDAGTFEIPGVPNGAYSMMAVLPAGPRSAAYARLDVRDADVDNLRLVLAPGVSLSVLISSEVAAGIPAPDLSRTTVIMSPFGSGSIATGQIRADGSVTISGITSGEYQVRLSNLPEDFYLKSATLGRADAANSTLTIGTESPGETLNIAISAAAGKLTGMVLDRAEKPFTGAQVVLVPDSKRRQRPDLYKIGNSDQNGEFSLRGIAPGEYKLFAWEFIESRAYLNADVMKTFEDRGIPVQVTAGGNAPVRIQLIPLENR